MAEALSWLDMMRRKEEMAAENEQLRLETDQNCIRLVTIHKSKGLEYPIVFCPFAWEGTNQDKEALPLCFHDEQSNWQLTGDLGSSAIDVNKEQYKREILAENCRLLYVALTRAKNRCYFAWGKIRNTKDSAAAYLFHRRHLSAISDWDRLNDEEMLADLSSFIQQAPGDIRLTKIGATSPPAPLPQREEAEKLLAREFKGSIDHTWKIASFTYLASVHKPHAEEITQGDEDYESGQTAISRTILQNTDSMLTFPHGTLSGIMLHEILEKLDFAIINDIDLKAIIAEKLIKYDFNLVWQPVIIELLKQLVKLPLGRSGIDEFSLSRLGADRCLREVEFYFPLSEITAGKIIEVLERSGIYTDNDRRINDLYGKLNFPPTRGYLRGFIDLVCEFQGRGFFLEWKYHYQGGNFEQYSPGSLKKVMSASSYILQYLIYTVALNKYLQRRMKNYSYEKNFGGVYYIFLRGVNSQIAGGNGIYFDLPDYNVVRQMDKLMLDHR
jgi:exodeoxyribonuclease V beta subunit